MFVRTHPEKSITTKQVGSLKKSCIIPKRVRQYGTIASGHLMNLAGEIVDYDRITK